MRVISQDGTYDMPYKRIHLAVSEGDIFDATQTGYTIRAFDGVAYRTIAFYSTADSAGKAMGSLHACYESGGKIFYFPEDKDDED